MISLFDQSLTYEKHIQKDAAVCRNCYNQINKINSFIEKLSHSCETFLNASTSSKRWQKNKQQKSGNKHVQHEPN